MGLHTIVCFWLALAGVSARSPKESRAYIPEEGGYTYTYMGADFTVFSGQAKANRPTKADHILFELTLRNPLTLTGGDNGSGFYSFKANDHRIIGWKVSAGCNELTKESLPKNGRFQVWVYLNCDAVLTSWSFNIDDDEPGGLHFSSNDSVDSNEWGVCGQAGKWSGGPELDLKSDCLSDRIAQQLSSPSDKDESRHLAHMLLGALFELGLYRDDFRKAPTFENLFATEYYNSICEELRRLANWDYTFPIEKMEQMLALFDAFKANRTGWPHASEAHWRKYYAQSMRADKDILRVDNPSCKTQFLNSVDALVNAAVIAQVSNDLPRALRYSFEHRFHSSGFTTPEEVEGLRNDFLKCGQTSERANAETMDDLRAGVQSSGPWHSWFSSYFQQYFCGNDSLTFFANTAAVNAKRIEAWREAFDIGQTRLPASTQPLTDRSSLEAEGEGECNAMSTRILAHS